MSTRDGRKKVLFVCIGNACRSPMAEAVALLDARDIIDAFSAGLMPIGFIPELTKQTLMKNGYWVEGLESKRISPGVWERVDAVINISGRPKEEAFGEYSKVVDWDIDDPFERGPEDYQRAFEKIHARVGELAEEYRREYAANRVAERRSRPRLYATSPMFMSLNGWNDARVVNISEEGLALSSDMALPSRPLQNLRMQFLDAPKPFEARCQMAWKSSNHRHAGIQFVDLTDEARQFIRTWISEQASSVGFQIQIDRTRERQSLPLAPPRAIRSRAASLETSALAKRLHVKVLATATSRMLDKVSENVKALRIQARATMGAAKPNLLAAGVLSSEMKPGPSWRMWGEFAAVTILTLVFTLVLHGLATHREIRNDVNAETAVETSASNEAPKPAPPTLPLPTTTASNTSDVSDGAVEKAKVPPPLVDSPAAGKPEVPAPVVNAPLAEKAESTHHNAAEASPSRAARPLDKSSRSASRKAASRGADKKLRQPQTEKPTRRFAASVNIPPVRKRQPETAARSLPVPPAIEVRMPETANLAPPRSADVRPAEPEERVSSAPLAKQPVTTAQTTGEVSVLADRYPSLRADGDSSKKLRHGAALQLGHLAARVVPVYPEEAKREGIQGTVKLHAVVDRYGSVKSMQSLSGPPILGAAVINAVRQWQYTETKLAGEPVETEVDLAVVFRLSNAATPKS